MNRPALRLAHAAPPPTVQVLTAATQPSAAGPALRLLPAGLPVPLDGVPTAQLPLSGLGARYLVAVARRAAAAGWPAPELTALVAELAPRCRHLRISRRTHRGLQPFAEAAAAPTAPSASPSSAAVRRGGWQRRSTGWPPPAPPWCIAARTRTAGQWSCWRCRG